MAGSWHDICRASSTPQIQLASNAGRTLESINEERRTFLNTSDLFGAYLSGRDIRHHGNDQGILWAGEVEGQRELRGEVLNGE